MKRRTATVAGLAVLTAAGVLAALAIAPSAAAYTWDQLPGLGYSLRVGNLSDGCHLIEAGYGNAPKTLIGNDCDTDFQAKLDAFVQATCPCAQTTTTATPAAAPEPTPTPTTAPSDPAPAPAPTTTEPTSPPTTTAIETTTTTSAIDAKLAELEAEIASLKTALSALTAKVDRVIHAGDVAWLAFQEAILNGSDPAAAADVARGTYLNAVNGLGEFAP